MRGSPFGGTRGGGRDGRGVSMLNTLAVMAGVRKAAAVDKSGGGVEIAPLGDDDADLISRWSHEYGGRGGPDLVLNETEVSRGGSPTNQHRMAASRGGRGAKAAEGKGAGRNKDKVVSLTMIGSRARDRAGTGVDQPHPRSPRAAGKLPRLVTPDASPEYLSPRTDDDMPTSRNWRRQTRSVRPTP